MEPQVAPGAPHPKSALSAALPAGQRGPTLRHEYGAGSAAPEKTNIVLDSLCDVRISHARDRDGSMVSTHSLTLRLPSHGVRQTGSREQWMQHFQPRGQKKTNVNNRKKTKDIVLE